VKPLSVYGRSKVEGERFALEYPGGTVLRTACFYAAFASNFVAMMLRLVGECEVIGTVADQQFCPAAAEDIVVALDTDCPIVAREIEISPK
jgi:dTDP-4-dehydrorhamnose reductase